MTRAFFDTSALFSAIISSTGAARELLRRHSKNQLKIVISEYVIKETQKNLSEDAKEHLLAFELLLDLLEFEMISVESDQIRVSAIYVAMKDAPIVAAAQAGQCEYLVTFDRKDLIEPRIVAEKSGLKICTPGDLLQLLRQNEGLNN